MQAGASACLQPLAVQCFGLLIPSLGLPLQENLRQLQSIAGLQKASFVAGPPAPQPGCSSSPACPGASRPSWPDLGAGNYETGACSGWSVWLRGLIDLQLELKTLLGEIEAFGVCHGLWHPSSSEIRAVLLPGFCAETATSLQTLPAEPHCHKCTRKQNRGTFRIILLELRLSYRV